MNVSLWISRKLQLAQHGSDASRVGVTIASIGVALSVIIMLCTVAVVLGFKHEITARILGFDGEVTILPAYDTSTGISAPYLHSDTAICSTLAEILPEASYSKRFKQPGILKTDNDFAGIYAVGFDESHDFSFEKGSICQGDYPHIDPNSIAISKLLAETLGLECGDAINAYFFVDEVVKARKFTISGLYSTGFSDYDKTVIFAPMRTLQKIAGADSLSATQIDVSIGDIGQIENSAAALQYALVDKYNLGEIQDLYPVDNVKHTGSAFFSWLDLLDTNVIVIFVLMSCVAAFTLVSSMFIIILARISTIGILRALGASKRQIRLIFINMIMRIVIIGMVFGNVFALVLLLVQNHTHILKLDPEMYYLDSVPVQINIIYFVIVNLAVLALSWLVLILPSRAAGNVAPATTMRYE